MSHRHFRFGEPATKTLVDPILNSKLQNFSIKPLYVCGIPTSGSILKRVPIYGIGFLLLYGVWAVR